MKDWPLREELGIVTKECHNPVIIIDDFDGGQGLDFDTYQRKSLNWKYVSDLIPDKYKFFVNSSSNRNRGIIFLFPPEVSYGCDCSNFINYDTKRDSIW